jgi:hypothetical protein
MSDNDDLPSDTEPKTDDVERTGRTEQVTGDLGEAEKPQDEIAPGPGADGALPKTG